MNRNVGKLVGRAVYVHRSAVALLPPKHAATVKRAESLLDGSMWNVVRVTKDSVSFLLYEQFEEIAFPALLTSAKVDVASGEVVRIDYLNPRQSAHSTSQGTSPSSRRSPAADVSRADRRSRGARPFQWTPTGSARARLGRRASPSGPGLSRHRLVPADEDM